MVVREFGLHRNVIVVALKAGKAPPFSSDGQEFGAVWLRKGGRSALLSGQIKTDTHLQCSSPWHFLPVAQQILIFNSCNQHPESRPRLSAKSTATERFTALLCLNGEQAMLFLQKPTLSKNRPVDVGQHPRMRPSPNTASPRP